MSSRDDNNRPLNAAVLRRANGATGVTGEISDATPNDMANKCSITNQPPLNPDALRRADDAASELYADGYCPKAEDAAEVAVSAYLAVAQPEVTGEQVNLAGWTCSGVHEPGDYSTCEECRDACDDLARFYNHMMQGTRPFKHWTGHPEVNDA